MDTNTNRVAQMALAWERLRDILSPHGVRITNITAKDGHGCTEVVVTLHVPFKLLEEVSLTP